MKTCFLFLVLIVLALHSWSQEEVYQVYFDTDKSTIPDTALIGLIKITRKQSVSRVLIEGHCDSVGSRAYNKLLSERRANEVFKLLSQNGINKKEIRTCVGYGKDRPQNKNSNEEERQRNRRVRVTFFLDDDRKETSTGQVQQQTKKAIAEAANLVLIEGDSISKKVLKEGSRLVFDNLLFEPGRHILRQESLPILRKVYDLLEENPSLELEIQGHVCCTTTEADGHDWDTGLDNLSYARAKTIYEYLVSNGIDKIRLEYKGFGGSQKIKKDESIEENRSVNRRVEFKVTSF